MQSLDYAACNPLDALGLVPHGVYRLTFAPENFILPDSWLHSNWPKQMAEQLDRLSATGYVYPIQDPATIVDDSTHGQAGVIDVMPRPEWAGVALQTAMQAVQDSYGHAKLIRVERLGAVSDSMVEDRPAEQQAIGVQGATAVSADTPGATIKRYAGWTLFTIVVLVVGLVVWKAPSVGGRVS